MGKSNQSRSVRVRRQSNRGGSFLLWSFLFFVTLILYFWGRVRIDLKLHENDRLKLERSRVQNEVNDLRSRVQELTSYQRIVGLAKKRGMVFVPASNQVNLYVETDGWKLKKDYVQKLQFAGFSVPGMENLLGVKKK